MQVVITSSQSSVKVVSNIGGLLGLCAGVSLLSLAEIIYWALSYGLAKMHGNKTGVPMKERQKRQKCKKPKGITLLNKHVMF
jgi:hypothetical protein